MEEIVDALTRPLAEEENRQRAIDRSTPRLVATDTDERLQALFLENGWTDRLPIIIPSEQRVAAMLSGTRRGPDEIVGTMRPTRTREAWQFTVEKVASMRSWPAQSRSLFQ